MDNKHYDLSDYPTNQQAVGGHVEPVVSRVDDHDYKFFDNSISYSHNDFQEGNINLESCIYLDVEYDEWLGHQSGHVKSELAVMISKKRRDSYS